MRTVTPEDLPDIQEWFLDRGMEMPALWFFSTTGLIVPGVAAGFLYVTNSGVATLDCFITCKDAPLSDRFVAVRDITSGLIQMAYNECNVKMLCCTSKIRSIKRIAEEFGFESMGLSEGFFKTLNS